MTLYGRILILRPLPRFDDHLDLILTMQNLDRKRARKILVTQIAVTLLAAVLGLFFSLNTALFALIGGAIASIANALFAYRVFGDYRAQEPGRLVARMYGAELLKLGFVAVAFAAVIVGLKATLDPVALFGAFIVVQILPPLLANQVAG